MNNQTSYLLFISFLFLLYSCTGNDAKTISTYNVSIKSFENVLEVDGYVEPANSTTLSCPRQVEGVIGNLIDDGTFVEEGEIVSTIEAADLQSHYDQLLISLENATTGLSKRKAELNLEYTLLEAQVKTNDANSKIAELDSLQLLYTPETQRKIKSLELEKVAIEKRRYKKKLKAIQIIQQSEIRKMELEIRQFSNRIESIKTILESLILRAPQKGLVMISTNPLTGQKFKVGDPIWGGMSIAFIPDMAQMKVKILAPEADFKYISVNDSVNYLFDALPGNFAYGKILKKTPVGQPYKQGSNVKYFEIEASVDSTENMPEPGFTANCRVYLKQLKDTIVVPQISVFDEDSIKVVYVKLNKGNGFEKRQVIPGISSSKETVITKGLKAKENIALSKPPASLIKESVLLINDSLSNIVIPQEKPDSSKQKEIPGD